MKDGPALSLLKLLCRLLWTLELGVRRAFGRLRERPRWRLAGGCSRCGRCCEEPALAVPRMLWWLPLTRELLLWWQWRINGFQVLREERRAGLIFFRCTHFDPATRACDSYHTRPAICRGYPRGLLDQAWPELFSGCGCRVRAVGAEGLLQGIEASELPADKKAELRRKLRLE